MGDKMLKFINTYHGTKEPLIRETTRITLPPPIYRVVYIATGKTFEGGLPPTPNRQALVVALAEMQEIVPYWRGKLEVRP